MVITFAYIFLYDKCNICGTKVVTFSYLSHNSFHIYILYGKLFDVIMCKLFALDWNT